MHKSRLAGFIIDCKTPELPAAARFWGEALNMKLHGLNGEEGDNYVRLVDEDRGLHIEVQRVTHDSRVQKVRTWVVMEAPTGQRFCVVQAKAPDFAARANTWK